MFDLELIGNGSRAEYVATPAAQRWGGRAVEVWALNYPGYGTSGGAASLDAVTASALAAFDAITKEAGERPVIVSCHSLGCAAGLCVASHRRVAGIILLNPPPLRQLITGNYCRWWNLWVGSWIVAAQVPLELNAIANGSKICTPAVFFSAEQDAIVPPAFHRMVYDRYAGPKRLVLLPDAGHNSPPDVTEAAVRAAYSWLWSRL